MIKSTREALKSAALELFLEAGYAKATIGAIEEAAGLAPRAGAFYRYFKSKEALLEEVALERITETPDMFGFEKLVELGDTRAELILIAQTYESAIERQARYWPLIDELRRMNVGVEFEHAANNDMLDALCDWIATKRVGREAEREPLSRLCIIIFGSPLFYFGKAQQGIDLDTVERDKLIDDWASLWAQYLDRS